MKTKAIKQYLHQFISLTLSCAVVLSSSVTLMPQMAYSQSAPADVSRFGVYQVPNTKSPGGADVFYDSGKKDSQGRYLVWATESDGKNTIFRQGVIQPNNKIAWFNYPGSNYPQAKVDTKPLPKGQSLTVVTNAPAAPTPAGQSEFNSPQKETVLQSGRFKIDRSSWRPSQLKKTLDWSQKKSDAILKAVGRFNQGRDTSFQSPLDPAFEQTLDRIPGRGAQLGMGMLTFYVALGMVAAATLMRDHPNEPMVWADYMQSLTDPVGWLMMAGFMAAAGPFMARMGSGTGAKAMLRSLPWFAAGMVAGTLAQTLIAYSQDPDVKMCIQSRVGLDRDLAACDRAYERLGSAETLTNQLVPSLVNILAAGGIYLGVQYLTSVTGLSQILRTGGARLFGSKANAAAMVGGALLFLGAYSISTSVFEVERGVRNMLIADATLAGNHYGSTISQSEDMLFREWLEVKKRGFTDRPGANADKPLCPPTPRKGWQGRYDYQGPVAENCVTAYGPADFFGLLDRYSNLQSTWRNTQMAQVNDSYSAWLKKVAAYTQTLNSSKKVYEMIAAKIKFSTEHKNTTPSDSRGFNAAGLADIRSKLTPDELALPPSMKTTWAYVELRDMVDFAVTSMACGPSPGFVPDQGMLSWTADAITSMTTANFTPQKMIEDGDGVAAYFFPPRVVATKNGDSSSICQTHPTIRLGTPLEWISNAPKFTPENFLVRDGFFEGFLSPSKQNLLDYILANMQPDFKSNIQTTENVQFAVEGWWRETVEPSEIAQTEKFRADYKGMLNGIYKKALTRTDYRWAEPGPWEKLGFDDEIKRLRVGTLGDGSPGPENRRRLAYGTLFSLRDELSVYLGMLAELHHQTELKRGATNEQAIQGRIEAQAIAATIGRLLKNLLEIERSGQRLSKAEMDQSFEDLAKSLGVFNRTSNPAPEGEQQLRSKLIEKVAAIYDQIISYHQILTTFER